MAIMRPDSITTYCVSTTGWPARGVTGDWHAAPSIHVFVFRSLVSLCYGYIRAIKICFFFMLNITPRSYEPAFPQTVMKFLLDKAKMRELMLSEV